jgi:hypothetical protein
VVCDPDDTPENEPVCGDEYVDMTNGGCNADPAIFQAVNCGETICGESGTYLFGGLNYRDTDWFVAETPGSEVTWSVEATFPVLIFIIDGNNGCDGLAIIANTSAAPCELASLTATVEAGTYWFWVGPSVFSGVPCGSQYRATLDDSCLCIGDVDNDGDTDVNDLLALLAAWGTADANADLDGSGIVDAGDLLILLANWNCSNAP